jgi:hypothetical protein
LSLFLRGRDVPTLLTSFQNILDILLSGVVLMFRAGATLLTLFQDISHTALSGFAFMLRIGAGAAACAEGALSTFFVSAATLSLISCRKASSVVMSIGALYKKG